MRCVQAVVVGGPVRVCHGVVDVFVQVLMVGVDAIVDNRHHDARALVGGPHALYVDVHVVAIWIQAQIFEVPETVVQTVGAHAAHAGTAIRQRRSHPRVVRGQDQVLPWSGGVTRGDLEGVDARLERGPQRGGGPCRRGFLADVDGAGCSVSRGERGGEGDAGCRRYQRYLPELLPVVRNAIEIRVCRAREISRCQAVQPKRNRTRTGRSRELSAAEVQRVVARVRIRIPPDSQKVRAGVKGLHD